MAKNNDIVKVVCENASRGITCDDIYDCCDCGGNDCGCAYCWSCNACDTCKGVTNEVLPKKVAVAVIYVECTDNKGIENLVTIGKEYKLIRSDIRNKGYYIHVPNSKCIYLWVNTNCFKIVKKINSRR